MDCLGVLYAPCRNNIISESNRGTSRAPSWYPGERSASTGWDSWGSRPTLAVASAALAGFDTVPHSRALGRIHHESGSRSCRTRNSALVSKVLFRQSLPTATLLISTFLRMLGNMFSFAIKVFLTPLLCHPVLGFPKKHEQSQAGFFFNKRNRLKCDVT